MYYPSNALRLGDTSVDLLAKHFHSFTPKPFFPPFGLEQVRSLSFPERTVHPLDFVPGLSHETKEVDPHGSSSDIELHSENKGFTCRWGDCRESFSTRSGLATHCSSAHLLSHAGTGNKRQRVVVSCLWNGCTDTSHFTTLKQLTKHLASPSHIGQTPYLSKKQEMEAIEEEDSLQQRRKYPCPFPGCGKRFTDSSNRKKHERTHDINRPRFQCTEPGCPKSYTTRADLNVHLRVHRKDRANICTYPGCNKAFVRTSELYAHERTHDNMLPHNCDKCGRSFRERARLVKHQKSSHPEMFTTPESPLISPGSSPLSSPQQSPQRNEACPLSQLYAEACK
jgi:uncharacterized Zn-finger protein